MDEGWYVLSGIGESVVKVLADEQWLYEELENCCFIATKNLICTLFFTFV